MKNLNSVHLNGLRALEAVGRLGSLQAAADELGVTIGAVSQQVIKAEAQLGRPVFERTPKGMAVTEAGIVGAGAARRRVSGAVGGGRPSPSIATTHILTISVAPVLAARWLVHRLDRFAKRHPDIRLRIDATTQLVNPATSDVDIGIRVGNGQWPGVKSELLLAQEIFPVVTPQIAATLKEPADLLERAGRHRRARHVHLGCLAAARPAFPANAWKSGMSSTMPRSASMPRWPARASCSPGRRWQPMRYSRSASVDPFGIRAKTGFGHYFITAEGVREPKKVTAFKAWIREEMEESMRLFR